jgi:hypothetical protein
MTSFGDSSEIVGVEILFSDDVSVESIKRIKTYIEKTYDFDVDNTTYMDLSNAVKIIIVRY